MVAEWALKWGSRSAETKADHWAENSVESSAGYWGDQKAVTRGDQQAVHSVEMTVELRAGK